VSAEEGGNDAVVDGLLPDYDQVGLVEVADLLVEVVVLNYDQVVEIALVLGFGEDLDGETVLTVLFTHLV
jgi:hypothetical protein